MVQENEEALGPSNFIDAEYDSEPENGVLQLESAVSINSIEVLSQTEGNPEASAFNYVQVIVSSIR